MSWVHVSRMLRTEKQKDQLQKLVDTNKKHWEDVALDLGFDPEKNVRIEEREQVVNISISEELDLALREEPGEWR